VTARKKLRATYASRSLFVDCLASRANYFLSFDYTEMAELKGEEKKEGKKPQPSIK